MATTIFHRLQPAEGPLQRQLRLAREARREVERKYIICQMCGGTCTPEESYRVCVHHIQQAPDWSMLCERCALKLSRALYGRR